MNLEEERLIIKRVLSGNIDAFERLVIENQSIVFNTACQLLGNEQDALDISQEVFLKAFTHLSSFKGDCKFSTWLYKITYRKCIDVTRRQNKILFTSLYTTDSYYGDENYFTDDFRHNPEYIVARKDVCEAIDRANLKLSDRYRNILFLRLVKDMSYKEIAEKLGISMGTVKSTISKAKKALVKFLNVDYSLDDIKEILI